MNGGSLWRISVAIGPEAEEAVSALLERIFAEPASVYVDARSQDTVASVFVSTGRLTAQRAVLRAGLQSLKAAELGIGPGRVRVTRIRREDWAESWKRHFKPLEIGSALLLKPSWSRRRPKKNQAVVVLDPGLSFGTGQHPTTRFCLEQLVSAYDGDKRRSFFDIGTGSGILAIAAAKLGYRPVAGIDSDAAAIRIAQANAAKNGVSEAVQLACRDLARLPVRGLPRYDLVCANLIFDLLLEERERIVSRLKPGGRLVLAGILHSEFPAVRTAYEGCGLQLAGFEEDEEWAGGAFRRPA